MNQLRVFCLGVATMAICTWLLRQPGSANAQSDRLRIKSLTIVDNRDNDRIRIAYEENTGPSVTLLSPSGKPAIQIGTLDQANYQHIRLYDSRGKIVSQIVTAQDTGASTLYLGDSSFGAKVELGSIPTDVGGGPSGDWGLGFRAGLGFQKTAGFEINRRGAGKLYLVREDLSVWSSMKTKITQ